MNWYYEESGQQAGPVDDAGIESLAASGRITAGTLVWTEGMANWQPYGDVRGAGTAGAIPPVLAAAAAGGEAVCVECHGVFPLDETIQVGAARVCANCKPIFVQKMREGVDPTIGAAAFELAPIGSRFAARIIDGLILWAAGFALNVVFLGVGGAVGNATGGRAGASAGVSLLAIALLFVQLAMGIAYEVFLIGKFGATLGKMACKIKVVVADGTPVSYGRALGRYFAAFLSSMICLIGFLMAFFDDQKRTLHDRICNTRVIMK